MADEVQNRAMAADNPVRAIWERARAGDLRTATEEAGRALTRCASSDNATRVELHLVSAFCAMRQGHHAEASRSLDAAQLAADADGASPLGALRIATWRAELAYFQGRYSAAEEKLDALVNELELHADAAYAAFALRIRIAILLARTDYERIAAIGERALRLAQASGDDYVHVQVLNVLGAFRFDRATSKLPEHARSHLSSIEPRDTPPLQDEAQAALALFERAREVAERAHYDFAAWYVAGNIERLEILLGHAERAVRAIRKRLQVLQARGARYDEIVARSNLAWGLRTLGHHREALHELDVALEIVRQTGAFNVLLEFLHYDRSVVLYALGDVTEARASYRRYLRQVSTAPTGSALPGTAPKRPLEPYFLKQVDRCIAAAAGRPITVDALAQQCGVSCRTLEKAFVDYRGITPVAHLRNLRLDGARRALEQEDASVGAVAERFGFRSATTFALEYRKRFGIPPSRTRRRARA
jgi:AraC-like DNA-binding protein